MSVDSINLYGVELPVSRWLSEASSRIPLARLISLLEVTLVARFDSRHLGDKGLAEYFREHFEGLLRQEGFKYIELVYPRIRLYLLVYGRVVVNAGSELEMPLVEVLRALREYIPVEMLVYLVHVPSVRLSLSTGVSSDLDELVEGTVEASNRLVELVVKGELEGLEEAVGELRGVAERLEHLSKSKGVGREVRKLCIDLLSTIREAIDAYRRGDIVGLLENVIALNEALVHSCSSLRNKAGPRYHAILV